MNKIGILLVSLILLTLSSCQIIGDIFKAGVGVGIFIVVAIIAIVIFIVAKVAGRGK
jgi:hypothetical protein